MQYQNYNLIKMILKLGKGVKCIKIIALQICLDMCEDVISAFSGSCRLSKRRGIPHFFDLIFWLQGPSDCLIRHRQRPIDGMALKQSYVIQDCIIAFYRPTRCLLLQEKYSIGRQNACSVVVWPFLVEIGHCAVE